MLPDAPNLRLINPFKIKTVYGIIVVNAIKVVNRVMEPIHKIALLV